MFIAVIVLLLCGEKNCSSSCQAAELELVAAFGLNNNKINIITQVLLCNITVGLVTVVSIDTMVAY